MNLTLSALGPFPLEAALVLNSTRCPSINLPSLISIEDRWTKSSGPPESGMMNPYPLSGSYHFTVPSSMSFESSQATNRPNSSWSAFASDEAVRMSFDMPESRPSESSRYPCSGTLGDLIVDEEQAWTC